MNLGKGRYVSHKPMWRPTFAVTRGKSKPVLICIAGKHDGSDCNRQLLPGQSAPEDHWELVYDK